MDDELPGLHYLKTLCLAIPTLEVVAVYNDPEKALAEKDHIGFDIGFIDIEMPGMSGIELARALQKPVIFTTAYKEYAVEAFDLDALDYLVKPINDTRLRQALDKAAVFLQNRQQTPQILNTDRGKGVIDFNEILIINTALHDARDKQLVYLDGRETILKNYSFQALKSYTKALVQVNKRQMIALKQVKTFTNNEISLESPTGFSATVSLSSTYRDEFFKTLKGGDSSQLLT